jgi:hypothetical protein
MTAMTLAMRLKDRLASTKGPRGWRPEDVPVPMTRAYAPVFFNEWEWSFLKAIVETVVPSGEDGARDATGVPMFIDRRLGAPACGESSWHMLAPFLAGVPPVLDYQMRFPLRDLYRHGIAVSNKTFFDETGRDFTNASEAERRAFLIRLAAGRVKFRSVCGQAFFRQLLTDIKQGCSAVW